MPQHPTGDSAVLFDQRRALNGLRRHVLLIVLVALVGAALGIVHAARSPEVYSAQTQLQLGSSAVADVLGITTNQPDALTAQSNAVSLLQASTLQDAVTAQLGPVDPVVATPVADSSLVAVSATGPSRQRAVDVTQEYVDQYVALLNTQTLEQLRAAQKGLQEQNTAITTEVQSLDQELAAADAATRAQVQGQQASRRASLTDALGRLNDSQARIASALAAPPTGVLQVTKTVADSTPPRSGAGREGILGGLLGLALAGAVVLLLATFDDRVRETRELVGASGGLYLGAVAAQGSRAVGARGKVPPAEAWRVVWAQLTATMPDLREVLVVPAGAAGARGAADGLTRALVQDGRRVVLADLVERGGPAEPGREGMQTFTDIRFVREGSDGQSLLVPFVGVVGPSAREDAPAPAPEDSSDQFLSRRSLGGDVVVLSAGPVTTSGAAAAAAARSRCVVVVAVLGSTRRIELSDTLDALQRLGVAQVGVVALEPAAAGGSRRGEPAASTTKGTRATGTAQDGRADEGVSASAVADAG